MSVYPAYGNGFGKTGTTLPNGEVVVTSEDLYSSHWLSISRHSTYCTCSFCEPWSLKTYQRLPKPGKFGIDVPSRENPYRWTHVHFRWGIWIYFITSQKQFFPSIWPFFHADQWEEKTCEVQRSN
jgi:hypothetical protein